MRVDLDYRQFSQAIGGNYASRLRLAELPACALTMPQLAKCQIRTPLTRSGELRRLQPARRCSAALSPDGSPEGPASGKR